MYLRDIVKICSALKNVMKLVNSKERGKNSPQNAYSYIQTICRVLNNMLAKQLQEFAHSKLMRVGEGGKFHKTQW